jgi:hypothetical protein
LPRLLQKQPWIVEQELVVERDVTAVGRHFDAGHALDGRQEMRLGVRVIDRPPRIAVPVGACAAARVISEPCHVELGLRRGASGRRRFTPELRAREAAEEADGDAEKQRLRAHLKSYSALPLCDFQASDD